METTTDILEQRLAEWRTFLSRRQAIQNADIDELEDHLRGQISAWISSASPASGSSTTP